MARAALDVIEETDTAPPTGVVVTKYGHSRGGLPGLQVFEAGHPIADDNSFAATQAAIEAVSGLGARDVVLFLISGGGSALFEKPLVTPEELAAITDCLLRGGADIVEINTIRKRLSAVKGGRFAHACAPARIHTIILSDILGDPVQMIASGPAHRCNSTTEEALRVAERYNLPLSSRARELLERPLPAVEEPATHIVGSVSVLCAAAALECRKLGYAPTLLTDRLNCTARDAGAFLAAIAKTHAGRGEKRAFIAGGETIVRVSGTGKGGRNQEMALAAALELDAVEGACVFSVGSDGTDGPTDAAGGYADGTTAGAIRSAGLCPLKMMENNDSYHALKAAESLIITGPTGTNVNDISVCLVMDKPN
jgi:hydroxypyruvate reductase